MHEETTTQNLVSLVQNHVIAQLRDLTSKMTPDQKIEVTQVLLYQVSKTCNSPLKLLVPRDGQQGNLRGIWNSPISVNTDVVGFDY